MSAAIVTRPALKSDAAEVALLVNIATHGGISRGWAHSEGAGDAYDPIEVGRREMMATDSVFGWLSATIAECDGEVVGMMLGYREPDHAKATPPDDGSFMVPLRELEAEAEGAWFISMLGVHIGWRGRGVGSRLLDVADLKRMETAARGLALIVEDSNEGARRLYARRGFAVQDRRPMRRIAGVAPSGHDWLLMVKE